MKNSFAEAEWRGGLQDGEGTMRLGSGGLQGSYSFASRFESGPGTNPEELLGAALAGCFSMALSGDLGKAGYTPDLIQTRAQVTMDRVDGRSTVTNIHLVCEAQVPEIDEATFQEISEGAKQGCPVSRALAGVEISLEAGLIGA